eukprot:NODE_139_length_17940_cov_0.254190.p1 type:complete len:635 gc:universal NODE_139_length_17940_cov_0.254190:10122-12026(+)
MQKKDRILSFKEVFVSTGQSENQSIPLSQHDVDELTKKMIDAAALGDLNHNDKSILAALVYRLKEPKLMKSSNLKSETYKTYSYPESFPGCFVNHSCKAEDKSPAMVQLYRGKEEDDDSLDVYVCRTDPYEKLADHITNFGYAYFCRLNEIEIAITKIIEDKVIDYTVFSPMPECFVPNSHFYQNTDNSLKRVTVNDKDYLDQVLKLANSIQIVREKAISNYPDSISFNIKSFYDSVYTHTLSWTMKSKVAHLATNQKEYWKSPWFNHLDGLVRDCKNKGTKGILNGSLLFHDIIEMHFRVIDLSILKMAKEAGIKNVIRRGDTLEFFALLIDADISKYIKLKLKKVLSEFRLNLNVGSQSKRDGLKTALQYDKERSSLDVLNNAGFDLQLAAHVVLAKVIGNEYPPNLLYKKEMSTIPTLFAHIIAHNKYNNQSDDLLRHCLIMFPQHWQYQTTVQSLHYIWYAICKGLPKTFDLSHYKAKTLENVLETCAGFEYPLNALVGLYNAISTKSTKVEVICNDKIFEDESLAVIRTIDYAKAIRIRIEGEITENDQKVKALLKCFEDEGLYATLDKIEMYTHQVVLKSGKGNWPKIKLYEPTEWYIEQWDSEEGALPEEFIESMKKFEVSIKPVAQ